MVNISWSILVGWGASKGPTTKEGFTTTRSIPLSSAIFHASFSAVVFTNEYHSYIYKKEFDSLMSVMKNWWCYRNLTSARMNLKSTTAISSSTNLKRNIFHFLKKKNNRKYDCTTHIWHMFCLALFQFPPHLMCVSVWTCPLMNDVFGNIDMYNPVILHCSVCNIPDCSSEIR